MAAMDMPMIVDPLAQLPDAPAIRQIQDALWGAGQIRGAAVMVGAGMSKAAGRAAEDSRSPPLWRDFARAMTDRLQTLDETRDALQLADEYEAALGRHALDSLIRDQVRDGQWNPSTLHERLLGLPWSDVLTTNWDTLLERTQLKDPDRVYEVVRTPEDIARTRTPRIVKLHGSLPSHTPFIFTGEDFRTYPRRFAPFVNLAQEVLLENELCLVGFSGDDPNFVQWSGWVRDQLGVSARRIRLVGALDLTPSRRKVLEQHNVSPIDLSPAVRDEPAEARHVKALQLFLDSLWAARPQAPHVWIRAELKPPQIEPANHPNSLEEILVAWERDRAAYPGWAVAPHSARMDIRFATTMMWASFVQQATAAPLAQRIRAVSELSWRFEVSLWPLDTWLIGQIDELIDGHVQLLSPARKALLLRLRCQAARLARDGNRFQQLIERLDAPDGAPEVAAFERALWARDRFDFPAMESELGRLTGEDPLWRLRRASLEASLGKVRDAAHNVRSALLDIQSRRRQDPRSIWLLSREAWASLMMRAAQFEPEDVAAALDDEVRSEQRARYAAVQCEPWDEIYQFDRDVEEQGRKQRPDGEDLKLHFEPGIYYESPTITFVSHTRSSPVDGLIMLSERVGLPEALGSFGILGSRLERALELELDTDVGSVWRVATFLRNYDKGLIDRAFNRIAIAAFPDGLAEELYAAVKQGVFYGLGRMAAEEKNSHWASRTRLLLQLCSRLVVRFSPSAAKDAFDWGIELAASDQLHHWWLFSAVDNLLNRSLEAIPPTERHAVAFAVLAMPLPGEKARTAMDREWPDLSLKLRPTDIRRPAHDPAWSHRIAQLLQFAGSPEELKRARSLWRLLKLHEAGALTAEEIKAFATRLWAQVGPDGVPLHTDLHRFVLLRLPEDRPGRAEEVFRATVVQPLLSGEISATGLNDLAGAAAGGSVTLTLEEARAILTRLLQWRPPEQKPGPLLNDAEYEMTRVRRAIGVCVSRVLLPAFSAETAPAALLDEVTAHIEAEAGPWLEPAAEMIRLQPAKADAIRSALRRGLASGADEELRHAVFGVTGFLRGPDPDRATLQALVLAMTAACSVRRDVGLSWLLMGLSEVARSNGVGQDSVPRLLEILEALWSDLAYVTWVTKDPRTASMSLLRRDCVRLASALAAAGVNMSIVAHWLSLENTDPLPEVRFALAEWDAAT